MRCELHIVSCTIETKNKPQNGLIFICDIILTHCYQKIAA